MGQILKYTCLGALLLLFALPCSKIVKLFCTNTAHAPISKPLRKKALTTERTVAKGESDDSERWAVAKPGAAANSVVHDYLFHYVDVSLHINTPPPRA
jgi:hypothetical protein